MMEHKERPRERPNDRGHISSLIRAPIKSSRSRLKTHQINFARITDILLSHATMKLIQAKTVDRGPPLLGLLNPQPVSHINRPSNHSTFIISFFRSPARSAFHNPHRLTAVTWNQSCPYSSTAARLLLLAQPSATCRVALRCVALLRHLSNLISATRTIIHPLLALSDEIN